MIEIGNKLEFENTGVKVQNTNSTVQQNNLKVKNVIVTNMNSALLCRPCHCVMFWSIMKGSMGST